MEEDAVPAPNAQRSRGGGIAKHRNAPIRVSHPQ
jgi:hypothetical protein